jgi:GTP cyclohydrolase III
MSFWRFLSGNARQLPSGNPTRDLDRIACLISERIGLPVEVKQVEGTQRLDAVVSVTAVLQNTGSLTDAQVVNRLTNKLRNSLT